MKRARTYRIGWWMPLAISFALAGMSCARPTGNPSNASCVTRLQLPVYPPIAQSARLSISLTGAVLLANDGSVQSMSFENIGGDRADLAKLFFPELERSLKGSQFSGTCGGKTVRLVFDFRMNGTPPNKMNWFGFPNGCQILGRFAAALAETRVANNLDWNLRPWRCAAHRSAIQSLILRELAPHRAEQEIRRPGDLRQKNSS